MASPTRWTWVWVNSGSLWWTGRPGMLRFMGSQRVRHDWATRLNWIEGKWSSWLVQTPTGLYRVMKQFYLAFMEHFLCQQVYMQHTVRQVLLLISVLICWQRLRDVKLCHHIRTDSKGSHQDLNPHLMEMSLSRVWELVMDREAWHAVVQGFQKVRHDWVTELNWTELNYLLWVSAMHATTYLPSRKLSKLLHISSCLLTYVLDTEEKWTIHTGDQLVSV